MWSWHKAGVDCQTAGHRTSQAEWGRCLHVPEKGERLYCCVVFRPFAWFSTSGESVCVGVCL